MPQLDKVTFYYQSFIVTFVFLLYHFYAIRVIITPLYGNLKMRETCCWWADFDRDLADWWFGEHKIFMQLSYNWSLNIIGALHYTFITYSFLHESVNFLFNDSYDLVQSKSSKYFDEKYKLLKRVNDFINFHRAKNNVN